MIHPYTNGSAYNYKRILKMDTIITEMKGKDDSYKPYRLLGMYNLVDIVGVPKLNEQASALPP